MEVILSQDVAKLGKAGSVVKVKEGFARNFLIPNKLAVPLTKENLKRIEQEKEKQSAHQAKLKKESETLRDRLAGISLTIPVLVHDAEKIYGSIAAQEISAALGEEGVVLDKSLIALDEPIKALGIYEIPVNLHPEVSAKIKVWIVKK
jgi:large subunit ribosomal protein L9